MPKKLIYIIQERPRPPTEPREYVWSVTETYEVEADASVAKLQFEKENPDIQFKIGQVPFTSR